MKKYILFSFFSMICFMSFAQIEMAKNYANTIMTQYPDSIVVKKYINHLMQDKQMGANSTSETSNQRPANWNYEIGVVLEGMEAVWRTTGDPTYLNYIRKIVDHFIDDNGNIKTYAMDEFNLDNIPSGRQLVTLYQSFHLPKYLKAAQKLRYQLDWQPKTREGGYWHKLKYPHQMWLDGLYMAEPFTLELALLIDDKQAIDHVAEQFILMEKVSRDPNTGLLYHGYDESKVQRWSNPTTGQSPEFWSRAMGWYILGLVEVLEKFPAENPHREVLLQILERTAATLEKYQDPSGTWWQITNKPSEKGNYLESSGSSMFVAAMLKATRLGLLNEHFRDVALKGYKGIMEQFVVKDASGIYHFTTAVSGAGLGGNPYRDGTYDYYVKEPKRDDDLKAIGPWMQAAIEIELMETTKIANGKTVLLDNYFNNEMKDGKAFHYLWNDTFDSGFSWFGTIFKNYGAILKQTPQPPSKDVLKEANVYIIVDPDTYKETASPNTIEMEHIAAITEFVKEGGALLLMTNDTTNAEFFKENELAKAFGIAFTGKNINFVKNDNYIDGTVITAAESEIFTTPKQLYIKELVTLKPLNKNVKVHAQTGKDIILASVKYGKGKVFVIGDPWIYNEYLCGRKLPKEYQNYVAAQELALWLLK